MCLQLFTLQYKIFITIKNLQSEINKNVLRANIWALIRKNKINLKTLLKLRDVTLTKKKNINRVF